MALAHSFYAEQAAVLGDLDEARRRRQFVLDFYGESPEDPFAVAARIYSQAKMAILDGDLDAAERHYRAATEGFGRLDRPVMNSICLGMVADFDERAGDYPAAITTLEAAIATNESLLGGFTGSLQARLGWVLLHDGQVARAEVAYQRALDCGPPGAPHHGDLRRPRPGWRSCTGSTAVTTPPSRRPPRRWSCTGPTGSASSATASTPRPTSRPPPRSCYEVLAAIAAERDESGAGGDAARAGRTPAGRFGRRGAGVPAGRRRRALGGRRWRPWATTAFAAAFERGRHEEAVSAPAEP